MNDYHIIDYQTIPGFPGSVALSVRQQHVAVSGKSQRDANGRLLIKPQPFVYSRYRWYGDFSRVYDQWGNPLQLRGALGGNEPGPDALKWQLAKDQAVRRFREKAGNYQTNLYEIYHTRQMTIDLCAKTFNRIGNALFALGRRDWKSLCGHLGISYKKPRRGHTNPAEVWIEYQYGWMPLLSDVYTAINHPFKAPDYHVRTSATLRDTVREQWHSGLSDEDWVLECRYKAVMDGYIRVSNAAVQAASQYGIQNPLSSAWEVLPFSFVLDWALPVGPYLELLGSGSGLEFIDCSLNSSYLINVVAVNTYKPQNWASFVPPSTTGRGSCVGFARSVGNPDVPLPQFKNPLTTTHLANALSLLASGVAKNRKFG